MNSVILISFSQQNLINNKLYAISKLRFSLSHRLIIFYCILLMMLHKMVKELET
jgi:hypothetical protein